MRFQVRGFVDRMDGFALMVYGLGMRAEMCSGSEAGSYLRFIDFVHHSTRGLKVIKKKKKRAGGQRDGWVRLSVMVYGL